MFRRVQVLGAFPQGPPGSDAEVTSGNIQAALGYIPADKAVVDSLQNYVTPQMYGAKADGSTDDTAAIQAALDASSYVYIPDGTYMIYADDNTTGGILPKSNQTIILSENAVLKAITTSNDHYNIINIRNVSNVYIRGGKVQGEKDTHDGTTGEWGYGILVTGGQNVTIEKMEICDCWGDAVIITYSSGVSKNVKVIDCVLHDCRRQGVSVVGGEYLTIKDCEIYNISGTNPQYGIDIEPDGARYARNVIIDNCYIHDNAAGSIVIPDTASTATANEISNVIITNCNLRSINNIGGNNVNVSNCNIGTVFLGAENLVRFTGSTINYVYLSGGTGVFDNCDIVSNSGSYLINSSRDGYPTKKSKLTCYNCRLSTHDSATYVMSTDNGDGINGFPVDSLVLVNCSVEIGANCKFSQGLVGNELRLDGCKVVFKGAPTFVFQSGGNNASRCVFNNTEVECSGTPSYLFYIGTNYVIDLELSNCKFADTTNFMYEESTSSGKIRLFNNVMSTTNFRGVGNIEKVISNNPLSAIPSEYVTETELSTKNYITLNDLPLYAGGVS